MWSILIFLFLGMFIGYILNFSEKQKKINSKLQQLGVVFLLFSMGASIGANKEILKNIKNIGQVSLSFALLTSIFSIIVVYFLTCKFMRGEKN